ncbi:hypothetical protein DOY81_007408 [Sarcophaga bullata]|nr:hypothetical protein DOY81_007408 [Sarcophaga bullata]
MLIKNELKMLEIFLKAKSVACFLNRSNKIIKCAINFKTNSCTHGGTFLLKDSKTK